MNAKPPSTALDALRRSHQVRVGVQHPLANTLQAAGITHQAQVLLLHDLWSPPPWVPPHLPQDLHTGRGVGGGCVVVRGVSINTEGYWV